MELGRRWNSFEANAGKRLYCHKGNVKGDSGEGSKEEKTRESLQLLRVKWCDQNVSGNTDSRGHSDEASDTMAE